jgi:hypothetical protein
MQKIDGSLLTVDNMVQLRVATDGERWIICDDWVACRDMLVHKGCGTFVGESEAQIKDMLTRFPPTIGIGKHNATYLLGAVAKEVKGDIKT